MNAKILNMVEGVSEVSNPKLVHLRSLMKEKDIDALVVMHEDSH